MTTGPQPVVIPIAHAGHWAVDLLYLAPLLIAVAVLGYQSIKDRREIKRSGNDRRRPPPQA